MHVVLPLNFGKAVVELDGNEPGDLPRVHNARYSSSRSVGILTHAHMASHATHCTIEHARRGTAANSTDLQHAHWSGLLSRTWSAGARSHSAFLKQQAPKQSE